MERRIHVGPHFARKRDVATVGDDDDVLVSERAVTGFPVDAVAIPDVTVAIRLPRCRNAQGSGEND